MTVIQPVSPEDVKTILPLIQEYFPYYHMDAENLLKRINAHKYWCYKSVEKETITGYAEWEIIDEEKKVIRLNGIAVFPRYQGKGYATALMKRGEADARSRGMKKLTLIVGENNQPAKMMYTKNGWSYARVHLQKIAGQVAEVWEKNLK